VTPDTIRSLPPGDELDAVIAGLLGWKSRAANGVGPYWVCPDGTFQPRRKWSTDMADAWQLFQEAKGWLYSKRSLFLTELAAIMRSVPDEPELLVAWPDALTFFSPEAVSKAFALAVLAEQQPKE
jgi:hypothetical protein